MQTTATIRIIVKGSKSDLERKIQEWFLDRKENVLIEGYGYSDGSLLHYSISDVHEI